MYNLVTATEMSHNVESASTNLTKQIFKLPVAQFLLGITKSKITAKNKAHAISFFRLRNFQQQIELQISILKSRSFDFLHVFSSLQCAF